MTDREFEDSRSIEERMEGIRSKARQDVNRLQHQVQRAADWREYVRAKPVAAAAVASVLGFVTVKSLLGQRKCEKGTGRTASNSNGVTPLVASFAGSILKQAITSYLRKQLGEMRHG